MEFHIASQWIRIDILRHLWEKGWMCFHQCTTRHSFTEGRHGSDTLMQVDWLLDQCIVYYEKIASWGALTLHTLWLCAIVNLNTNTLVSTHWVHKVVNQIHGMKIKSTYKLCDELIYKKVVDLFFSYILCGWFICDWFILLCVRARHKACTMRRLACELFKNKSTTQNRREDL